MLFRFVISLALIALLPNTFASDDMEKRVFGDYERARVNNTIASPFRSIGQIGNFCTGTLIGSHFVLTAAHCVADIRQGQWIPGPTFAPGRNGNKNPLGVYNWKRIIVPKEYAQEASRDHDFALIILEKAAGNDHGVIPLGNPTKFANDVSSNIVGYPGDKTQGTMWKVFCPVSIDPDRMTLRHRCDTFGGMSGSAIYSYNSRTKKRSIIGVHTYGTFNHNGGVFLNQKNMARIKNWMKNPEAKYPVSRRNKKL